VLAALVAGFEVQTRLLLASHDGALYAPGGSSGLHPPAVVGVMGSTAASSLLLGLSPRQAAMAMGIAASRAGGLMANVGTMTKATHCGNAARMGLESALLAADGFTADPDILSAPNGFGAFYLGGAERATGIAEDYGKPFRIHEPGVAFKKYPSQYGTQRAVDAALAIVREHGVRGDQIVHVTIHGPRMDYVDRPRPASGLDGKFSFQYVTAVALLDGAVAIDSFSDARRFSPDVEALLPKIAYEGDASISADFDEMWIETLVTLVDGRTVRERCVRPTGIWGLPLTRAEQEAKARDCLGRAVPAAQMDEVLRLLRDLPACSAADVRHLLAILREPPV
jgi:aconitate decarboxylase